MIFALGEFSVSEIDVAPCRATATVALPMASELLTCWKPAMSPRWPWAMAKVEASSAAPETLRPVLTRFCVLVRDCWVRLRLSRAARALLLVVTEKLTEFLHSWTLLRPLVCRLPRLRRGHNRRK